MAANEVKIVLPELAESVVEGEILEWRVAEGERVELDAPLLDVASDKVNVELPSPHAGVLLRQLVAVGDMVAVDAPIAVIRLDVADSAEAEQPAAVADTTRADRDDTDDGAERSLFRADEAEETVHNPFATATGADNRPIPQATTTTAQPRAGTNRHGRVLAVPSARILARELGVDIATVPGSGPNGRVRRDDVNAFAEGSAGQLAGATPTTLPPPVTYHTPSGYADRERREPLRGMRRAIARQMSASHLYAVRTLVVDEADLSQLVALRTRLKASAEQQGVRLSYLPFVFKALVWALRQYPQLNTSLDEATQEIVHKTYYNIGLAVAVDAGLVVPVVRDADQKSILTLAGDINYYAERARAGELTADEMQGASFSVTNVGSIGSLFSFPIINSPDAAILGVHAIKDRPVAVDGEVAIRPMIYLSLSFDHRLVDGVTAAQFLRDIITRLETPEDWLLTAV